MSIHNIQRRGSTSVPQAHGMVHDAVPQVVLQKQHTPPPEAIAGNVIQNPNNEKEEAVNDKLKVYEIAQAFQQGKMPSNNQLTSLFQSMIDNPSIELRKHLMSEDGQLLLKDMRKLMVTLQKVVRDKNTDELFQSLVYHMQQLEMPLNKDAVKEMELPQDVNKEEMQKDTRKGAKSVYTIGKLILFNNEFRDILNELLSVAREMFGDASDKVGDVFTSMGDAAQSLGEQAQTTGKKINQKAQEIGEQAHDMHDQDKQDSLANLLLNKVSSLSSASSSSSLYDNKEEENASMLTLDSKDRQRGQKHPIQNKDDYELYKPSSSADYQVGSPYYAQAERQSESVDPLEQGMPSTHPTSVPSQPRQRTNSLSHVRHLNQQGQERQEREMKQQSAHLHLTPNASASASQKPKYLETTPSFITQRLPHSPTSPQHTLFTDSPTVSQDPSPPRSPTHFLTPTNSFGTNPTRSSLDNGLMASTKDSSNSAMDRESTLQRQQALYPLRHSRLQEEEEEEEEKDKEERDLRGNTMLSQTEGYRQDIKHKGNKIKGSAVQMKSYAKEKMPEEKQKELIKRLQKAMHQVQAHPDYQKAIDFILHLFSLWSERVVDVGHNVSGVAGEAAGTMTHKDSHWSQAAKEIKAILEDWAQGESMDPLIESVRDMFDEITSDTKLSQYYREVVHYLKQLFKEPGFVDSEASTKEGEALLRRGQELTQDRYKDKFSLLLDESRAITEAMANDKLALELKKRFKSIHKDLWLDRDGNPVFKPQLLEDMRKTLLPAALEQIKYIPIPRIEYSDPEFDVVVENIVLSGDSMIPNVFEMKMENYSRFTAKTHSNNVNQQSIVIKMAEIQAVVDDVVFYYKKKTGFPKMFDRGVASLVLGGKGISVSLRIISNSSNPKNTFQVSQCKCHVDDLKLQIKDSRHNLLYKTVHAMVIGIVRRQIAKAIEAKVVDYIEKGDQQVTRYLYKIQKKLDEKDTYLDRIRQPGASNATAERDTTGISTVPPEPLMMHGEKQRPGVVKTFIAVMNHRFKAKVSNSLSASEKDTDSIASSLAAEPTRVAVQCRKERAFY
ncbi:hypothetical protein BDF14DRAFT_1742337 [Spinellus fusiger]|nr:hypothetical protein BDF14DRAFT_1742337 [Spinellus fusiger]